jgi:hypothetical protein
MQTVESVFRFLRLTPVRRRFVLFGEGKIAIGAERGEARAQGMPASSKWAVFGGLTPKAQRFASHLKSSTEAGAACCACLSLSFI